MTDIKKTPKNKKLELAQPKKLELNKTVGFVVGGGWAGERGGPGFLVQSAPIVATGGSWSPPAAPPFAGGLIQDLLRGV